MPTNVFLVRPHREPEPDRVGIVEGADVVTPRAEPALQAQPLERERSCEPHPVRRSRRHDLVEHVGGELRRHEQLPPELTGERDAQSERLRPPKLDLARREERERRVGEILIGERAQHRAALRAGDVQRREAARHVGDGRTRWQAVAEQHLGPTLVQGRREHEEPVLRQAGSRSDPSRSRRARCTAACTPHARSRRRRSRCTAAADRQRPPVPARGTSRTSRGRTARPRSGSRASPRRRGRTTTAGRSRRSTAAPRSAAGSNHAARSQPAASPTAAPAARSCGRNGDRRTPRP